jgi:hypothetical protein
MISVFFYFRLTAESRKISSGIHQPRHCKQAKRKSRIPTQLHSSGHQFLRDIGLKPIQQEAVHMLCWSRGYSSMATNTWLTASDLTYYEFLTTSNSHIIAYTQSVCKYLSIWFYTTGLYSQDPLFYHDSVSTLPSFWEKPTANCVCIRTSFAYSFVCRTFPPAVAGQLPVGKRGWDSMQAEYYKEIICHLQLGVRTTYFLCGNFKLWMHVQLSKHTYRQRHDIS